MPILSSVSFVRPRTVLLLGILICFVLIPILSFNAQPQNLVDVTLPAIVKISNLVGVSLMYPDPPQQPPNYPFLASDITSAVERAIQEGRTVADSVAATPKDLVNFNNVIASLASDDARLSSVYTYLFMQHVAVEKEVRDAATSASEQLSEYLVESSVRSDVYSAVKAVFDRDYNQQDPREDSRLLLKTELDFRRNGLAKPKYVQDEIKSLQKEMSTLAIKFSQNLGEDVSGVWFKKDELIGVPEELVESWEKRTIEGSEEHKMTFKYPDILPTTKYAKLEATRRKAWVAYENRCPENVEFMVKVMQLRKTVAALLGYGNYADYVLEDRMAQNSTTVLNFLNDLGDKLKQIGQSDLKNLEALKARDSDTPFKSWDHAYYSRQLVEEKYNMNAKEVSEYFETDHTISEMLKIYETLFSLKFVEVSGKNKRVWHSDVRQFSVWRSDTRDFQGWLYMDLYPREGKFGHAASFDLVPSWTEGGHRTYCVTALACNFPKPSDSAPALLKFDDVVTAFHELGHSIHSLVSQTKYSRFHGTSVSRDFVETPSTMLENWCYSPEILRRISRHHKTHKPLPDTLINSLISAKTANSGLFNLRQLYLALFDMHIHTSPPATSSELTTLWNSMRKEISLWDSSPDLPAGEASFAHLMGGYEAGYYGYSYSRVFSSDMYASKFKGHELDPVVGSLYRDTVLAKGGSLDAMTLLHQFLGREPSNEAFLKSIGL